MTPVRRWIGRIALGALLGIAFAGGALLTGVRAVALPAAAMGFALGALMVPRGSQ